MVKRSIEALLNNSNIAQDLKEALTFMLLSKGYSTDEIKKLDDYVFIARKKGVGASRKENSLEYYDSTSSRKIRKRSKSNKLVSLTSNSEAYNKKDHTLYSLNGGEPTTKGRLVWLIVSLYQKEYNPTYEEISYLFNYKLNLLRKTIIDKTTLELLRPDRQKRFYSHDSELLKSKDGIQYAVSNQWSINKMNEIVSFAHSNGWKIEVINPKNVISSTT